VIQQYFFQLEFFFIELILDQTWWFTSFDFAWDSCCIKKTIWHLVDAWFGKTKFDFNWLKIVEGLVAEFETCQFRDWFEQKHERVIGACITQCQRVKEDDTLRWRVWHPPTFGGVFFLILLESYWQELSLRSWVWWVNLSCLRSFLVDCLLKN